MRARLLHDADPAFARIELANTALGAPVDVGAVLRAMRFRRGLTQVELARALGVVQATVARWEAGDAVPDGPSLHAAAFALGASPEEATALACAQGAPSGRLPEAFSDLGHLRLHFEPLLALGPLREVATLGLEAELWPRAARDARWDAALAFVIGDRAVKAFCAGRFDDAEAAARQGLRLPPTTQVRFQATHCFSALLEVATERGADPAVLAGRIEAWVARLPEGKTREERELKEWMVWERALRLAETERPDEGLAAMRRAAEGSSDVSWDANCLGPRLEVEIRAGRADRAEPLYGAWEGQLVDPSPEVARFRARTAHARGEAADEATMAAMRTEFLPWSDGSDWYTLHKIAKIERTQARLVAAGR